MSVSALRHDQPGLVVAAIPTDRDGVKVHDDWDNIGQRQTDSGRLSVLDVVVLDSEILCEPGPLGSPFASLRSTLGQLILTHIYLGLAEGESVSPPPISSIPRCTLIASDA